MEQLQASTLIMVAAFAFAFVSTLRFYRVRLAKVTTDQRSALTPTLLISISFLVGAITMATRFYSLLTLPPAPTILPPPSVDVFLPWILIAELAIPLFGFVLLVAVVASLRQSRLYILPTSLLIVNVALVLLSPRHPMDDPYLSLSTAIGSILIALPMVLFGYLWRKTKRTTALGMFVGLIIYLLYSLYYTVTLSEYVGYLGLYLVPGEYFGHVELYQNLVGFMPVVTFAGATSLSLIYWFFRYSDRKLGGEVIGYSLTIPLIATEGFMLLLTIGLVPLEYVATLLSMAVAAGVFILTGSYLYGRYRESHYRQTLSLCLFSYFAGASYLLFNIGQHIYVFLGIFASFLFISLPVGMMIGSFLFISAAYALDRPSLVLAPFVVVIPLIVLTTLLYPIPGWLLYTMIVATVVLMLFPGAMFAVLLRRMMRAKEKGRGRVLGIFMGLLFMLLAAPVQSLTASTAVPIALLSSPLSIMSSIIALIGALNFYLGISGRFDKWLFDRRR